MNHKLGDSKDDSDIVLIGNRESKKNVKII